jgi:sortase A
LEQGDFEYSAGFEDSNADIDVFTEENINKIQEYAEKNAKPIYTKTTDLNGKFTISELPEGAYLLVQTDNKDKYIVQTTLVQISKESNYNITVTPKVLKVADLENTSSITTEVNEMMLPYTGVLNWPIPVLVVIAILLFCIGWLKTFTNSKKSKLGIVFMILAVVAILIGGILLIYNNKEENRVKTLNENIVSEFEKEMEQYSELNDDGQVEKDLSWLDYNNSIGTEYSKNVDGITYIGILYFPNISNLAVPVIDNCTDSNLKLSACRYSGSINENNMVVAGHSYKSIFGKLSSNLTEGDIIYFKSLAGNIYKYKLDNIEYLLPTDVQEMQNGDWDFTVFTCSYDNQKRIAYRFIESD